MYTFIFYFLLLIYTYAEVREVRTGPSGVGQEVRSRRARTAPGPAAIRLDCRGTRRTGHEPGGPGRPPGDLRPGGQQARTCRGALDCTLVYGLVPNSTLEETVLAQATSEATALLGYAARTMALEDQGIDDDHQGEAVDRYARELVAKGNVWRTTGARPGR